MPLKELFKHHAGKDKGDKGRRGDEPQSPSTPTGGQPEFKFYRSDTHSQDVIHPPTGFSDRDDRHHDEKPRDDGPLSPTTATKGRPRSSSFREALNFAHRRGKSNSSNIPADLPEVDDAVAVADREAQWEKRATVLVGGNTVPTLNAPITKPQSRSGSVAEDDENIQEAIRLHEAGEYERSTAMFGRLADPEGANNPLSQVLYGLALRHGWGISVDAPEGLKYLRAAAKNSAAVEQEALRAGLKKGGSAKGELVLAIYELGNSYRNGWGVTKDPVAAREYYETAANLGDPDAQNEVAWCYLEGFGCKKDKFKAAKFYRMAEKQGNKTLGNSWIWKDKYNKEDSK